MWEWAQPVLVYGLLGAFVLFSLLWAVQLVRHNAGIVDVGWTLGVGLMAIAIACVADGWLPRRILVGVLGAAWAARLAGYILINRVLVPHEDGRYARMRTFWGRRAQLGFFVFFTAQSPLIVLFAVPFLPAAANAHPGWRVEDGLAVAVWILSVIGESWADRQLARFRADPAHRGRTCRDGLWRYSRHPNYFFEWLHWFTYVVMAIGTGGWAWTLIGPALMYVFLRWVTGIPHTERQALTSRGEDYRDYQQTTNMFFPWRPRLVAPGRKGGR